MYFQKYAMVAYAIHIAVFLSNTSALASQSDSEPKANVPLIADRQNTTPPIKNVEVDTSDNSNSDVDITTICSDDQSDLNSENTAADALSEKQTVPADTVNQLQDENDPNSNDNTAQKQNDDESSEELSLPNINNTDSSAKIDTSLTVAADNGKISEKKSELNTGDNNSTGIHNNYDSSSSNDKPLPPRNSSKSEKSGSKVNKYSLDSIPSWSLRTLGALAIVIFLILFLKGLIKRFAGPLAGIPSRGGLLEVLARYPFGKNQTLVLLKLDQKILLLCQTPQNIQTITELNEPEEVASLLNKVRDDNGESFEHKLERLLKGDNNKSKSIWGRTNLNVNTQTTSAELIDLTRKTRKPNFSLIKGRRKILNGGVNQ